MQRYLIVAFVLSVLQCLALLSSAVIDPSNGTDDLQAELLAVLLVFGLFLCLYMPMFLSLGLCFCRLSSCRSAVHCDDWPSDQPLQQKPASLLHGDIEDKQRSLRSRN